MNIAICDGLQEYNNALKCMRGGKKMRVIQYTLLTYCLLAVIATTSCSNGNDYTSSRLTYTIERLDIDIAPGIRFGLYYLLEDSIIFSNLFEYDFNRFQIQYFRYYFDTGEQIEIPVDYPIFASTGESQLLGDILFRYWGIRGYGSSGMYTALFGIDLNRNEFVRFTEVAEQTPQLVNITTYGNIIASLKRTRAGDIVTSYIELFNPETDMLKILTQSDALIITGSTVDTGTEYHHLASANGLLYVLYQTRESVREEWIQRIKVFCGDMEFLKSINIDNAAGMLYGIFHFDAFGRYLYFRKSTFESQIWRIEDEKYINLVKSWGILPYDFNWETDVHEVFRLARNHSETNVRLFYEQFMRSNNILLFDFDNDEWHEIALDIEYSYRAYYAKLNGNIAVINAMPAENNIPIFYLLRFSIN